jgi:putative tryptophan/tyrosine transport system substrate-binding protein
MRRREFLGVLGGTAAWPLAARAQQSAMLLIGFLHGGSQREWAHLIEAFRQGLSQAGFVEGRNIADIEFRWAEGQFDRLPGMAADLVNRQPALIATDGGTVTAQAAKRATSTIPIIFTLGGDPVKSGLVASLNRPGGNLTGVSGLVNLLVGKRLELLRELAPSAGSIGILVNPRNPIAPDDVREVQEAAGKLGLQTLFGNASNAAEIDAAFDDLRRRQARALIVLPDVTFISRRSQIVELAARHALPAIYFLREFAQEGGLMSYSGNSLEARRWAGGLAARVLKGEKPNELPVLQPTRYELVINLKTAKALGISVPLALQAQADEVIE